MSFYKPLSFPREINERRHDRHPVEVAGRVRELGCPSTGGKIRDVSLGGCRIRETDLPRNAEIWVSLGVSQPVRARVVWVSSGEAGCEFYAPLSRSDLHEIILQR